MPTLTGNIRTLGREPSRVTRVELRSMETRVSGSDIVTQEFVEADDFEMGTGFVRFHDVLPGGAYLRLTYLGDMPVESIFLIIPDAPETTLGSAIEAAELADGRSASELQVLIEQLQAQYGLTAAAADRAVGARNRSEAAADRAEGAASTVEQDADDARQAAADTAEWRDVSTGAAAVSSTAAELFGQYADEAEEASAEAVEAVESTSWAGDRLTVMGKTGPPLTGVPGGPGVEGARGRPGDTGPRGFQGDPGPRGERGPRGAQGPEGPAGRSVTITGTVENAASLPAAAELGDGYITHDDGHLHVWGGSWVDVGTVRGPQGPEGPVGPEGPRGQQGGRGPEGPQGDSGPKGETGDRGPQGPKGDKGDRGPKGDPGPRGPAGTVENVSWQDVQGKPSLSEVGHRHEIDDTNGLRDALDEAATRTWVGQQVGTRATPAYVDQQVGTRATPAYVDGRTPRIEVVAALPSSPEPSTVYVVVGND